MTNNPETTFLHQNIITSLQYLQEVISSRLSYHFDKNKQSNDFELPPLQFTNNNDPLSKFVQHYQLSTEESIMLLCALAPHILPHFFDALVAKFLPKGGEFIEFGGVKSDSGNQRGMLPTGETVLFILAGNDINLKLKLQFNLFNNHFFAQQHIAYLGEVKEGEPKMSGRIILDPEYVELFTTGNIIIPKMSTAFPAQYISTALNWEDLVLSKQTQSQIKEIENWVNHHTVLMNEWGMQKKLKPGYRALFYGPPGTGKTLTATLLGKFTNKPVFKVDLSMVVSKYIGETEKNLSSLFDKADNKDWILFFDEADAIFGKRTNVRDAHDKYANQEVSYLLQRIENFKGLTILASNFKGNIDDAFMRRFHSVIYFPIPKPEERLSLWQRAFPSQVAISDDVDWQHIANKYEITGSGIMNVVQYCCIELLASNYFVINTQLIQKGISKELSKEGKMISLKH